MGARRLRSRIATLFTTALLAAVPVAGSAVGPDEVLADPRLETRARELSSELRCLVCQNQSIDDSNAPLARDLRLLVRERLKAGDSDRQVRDYVVARYGEFVLLRPPFEPSTLLLWLTPLAALSIAALTVWRAARKRQRPRTAAAEDALTPAEEAHLSALLGEQRDPNSR